MTNEQAFELLVITVKQRVQDPELVDATIKTALSACIVIVNEETDFCPAQVRRRIVDELASRLPEICARDAPQDTVDSLCKLSREFKAALEPHPEVLDLLRCWVYEDRERHVKKIRFMYANDPARRDEVLLALYDFYKGLLQ